MRIAERIGSRVKRIHSANLPFFRIPGRNQIALLFHLVLKLLNIMAYNSQILLLSKSTITVNSSSATKLTPTRNTIKQQNTVE